MSDELENKKPKAPLIKHPKPEEVSSTVNDPIVEERKKTVVVVKKKTVVKKKVVVHKDETQNSPTQTHPSVAAKPESVGERKPVEKTSAPTNTSGGTKLSPEKIAEFMAKRPQEMKRVDPTTRPKPEGLRIETDRPPRQERSGSYQDRRPWNGPQGNRPGSNGPSGNPPAGGNRPPRQWADRSTQGNNAPNNTQGGPAGQNRPPRPWGDRPPQGNGQGGGRPWGDRPPQGNAQGGGRPWGDRPPQGGGQGGGRPWNGPQGPRPAGTGGPGAPGQNRPPRQWGDRPQGGGSGGYAGGRPGGFGGGRPGGFGGGRPGSNNNPPALDLAKKVEPKKFRSKKEKNYSKDKEKEELFEKALQQSKKQQNKANPVPKEIEIMEAVTVAELARKMNLKASSLISKLMSMGMLVTINEQIDADTATILASEYGTTIKIVSLYEETLIETEVDKEEDLEVRPPIVTIMGHVDHGKTKLLDAIRTANVAGGEHGGITQHIGAYQVHAKRGDITFLDTPGHEAFTLMRARGAQITDIIVLVVAANDGVMPQTLEAINHAKDAKVPIIVAINKIDLPDANPDKVRQQLSEKGLVPEPWGGQTMYCEISALKKLGLDELLETIALQAEVLELKANKSRLAEGKVIESKIDQGRGVVASVLVQKGTLKIGDFFIGGVFPGKVRAMFNDRGESIKEATPSMPVEILGFDGIPSSGDPFQAMASEREVRDYSEKRQELKKVEEAKNIKKITLANLYSTIQDGEVKELKVIIKGDVHGSVEALQIALEKLSTAEIRLNCIHASAGAIIESDVTLASASDAIIIGFHVRPTAKAQLIAEREKVEIRKYNIIYDAVDDIRTAMEGMLTPDLREDVIGQVQVRETFKVPKIGLIAGCMVTQGKVKRNALVHVIRDGIQIYSGKISSLRRFKDDAKEVVEGFECGIGIDNYQDLQVNDTMEIIEVTKIAKKLGEATTA